MLADQIGVFVKLLVAAALGAGMGFERDLHDKPAGVRTHILTAVASTLVVVLSVDMVEYYQARFPASDFDADPLRIFQAIVVGVSFIGAGTILKVRDEQVVYHLSTAASILLVSAVGIAVGVEQWGLAAGAALIAVAVNWLIGRWKERGSGGGEGAG